MTAAAVRRRAHVPADPLDLVPKDAVVAVAMSGGVDSSVAAARCVERGLRTFGVTLAMWPRNAQRERDRGCCSVDAVEDARRVATALGMAHYSWNLEAEFTRDVVTVWGEEYASGRTPNPCVSCNQRIKFGALLERALQAGATHLATGHYARTGHRDGSVTLHRALAAGKDQAYTLHRLDQRQLQRAVFPLGALTSKEQVRTRAAELGLVTAAKPDSQELCFVEGSVRADLELRLAGRFAPGRIVDVDGAVVGEHRGLPFYTVGQRSGLGLAPSRPDAAPRYVVAVNAGSNTITVGPRACLEQRRVRLDDTRWVAAPPGRGETLSLQLRAHAAPAAVTVSAAGKGSVALDCDQPVVQVAPGQAGVLYDGDEVLGGGVVCS